MKIREKLVNIAYKFKIQGKIIEAEQLGEGFINDTYIIKTSEKKYILQRKNSNVFHNIPEMMKNISKVSEHIKKKLISKQEDPNRGTLNLISTIDNKLYYKDESSSFWTVCEFIDNTICYQKAENQKLAFKAGAGIGYFHKHLEDFKEELTDILPGFHDIRYRFKQWEEVLKNDPKARLKDLDKEVMEIESRMSEMLDFKEKIEVGIIPKRVAHNDTKISNMLFDNEGNLVCVIDLDTVLLSTCLYDYGDAIRSYTNPGQEDDKDLSKVFMDRNIFEAYTKGYLSVVKDFLTNDEINNLAFAARYIVYEQVLRFLMDYIDGDRYYKIKYEDHNLVRARAQYKLLEDIEKNMQYMQDFIKNC